MMELKSVVYQYAFCVKKNDIIVGHLPKVPNGRFVENKNFCVIMFEITGFLLTGKKFCLRQQKFEITVFKITGFINVLNYIGK